MPEQLTLEQVVDGISQAVGDGMKTALKELLANQDIANAFSVKFQGISVPIQGGTFDIGEIEVEVKM